MLRAAITASFALAVIVSSPTDTHAQASSAPADPAAEALARPISPGSVALLLPHVNKPAAVERLTQALADQRPEVRAVAARVAFTTRNALLAQALTDALTREQSPVAGAEIVRALALIRGPAGDVAIRAALERFDSRASAAWVETLCRVRPADLWRQLPELPNAMASGLVLVQAARMQPDAAARAFAGVKDTPALQDAYLAMLSAARLNREVPPWPVLEAGLAAGGLTRSATAYMVVSARARGESLPGEAVEAIRALSTPDNSLDLAWLPVYEELARRKTPKDASRSMKDAIAILNPLNVPAGLAHDPVMVRLDASEIAAFRQVFGPGWKPVDEPQRRPPPGFPSVPPVDAPVTPSTQVTRLARPMSVGLMRDMAKLLDCRFTTGQVAAIDVQYRPTGQVRSATPVWDDVPAGCLTTASIVAALEVAPGLEPLPEARVDRLVIGIRGSDLECERQPTDRQVPSVRPGGAVLPPKKTRNVPPQYPQPLIEARVQGVVIIEAAIPVSGCVADATVLRSAHPDLDVAALIAVSEWRYEPARLDGIPVTAIMTVTVNFSLQQ